MNYSEMTDLEINKTVASACLDEWYDNGICVVRCGDEDRNIFNPCNSWADAGPIIQEHLICLSPAGYDDSGQVLWNAFCNLRGARTINPLRSAMIVSLMMQEK